MKKNIILVIVTAIICVGVTAFAYTYNASDIGYKNTNVSDAIDDLYDEIDTQKAKFETLTFQVGIESISNVWATRSIASSKFGSYLNRYTYIKLKSINSNSNCSNVEFKLFKSDWSTSVIPELNVKYSLNDYSILYGYVLSKNTTNSCVSTAVVELSN